MIAIRKLRAGVANFLATFTSRYTDRDGWWLFGLVEAELDGLEVDLLSPPLRPNTPHNQFVADAIRLFQEQVERNGGNRGWLRSATLRATRLGTRQKQFENRLSRHGADFVLAVRVETTNGRHIASERSIFISPHDPKLEFRSGRYKKSALFRIRTVLRRLFGSIGSRQQ